MYGAELAQIYDQIYEGRGKDYAAEAAEVRELIQARSPGASSLLDVACGTGSHLRHFAQQFSRVEGLEYSQDMIAIAAERVPGVTVHRGDMRGFELPQPVDAITCMFSSIAYMATTAELETAFDAMTRWLVPGGVIVIEPWVFPASFIPGYVAADLARDERRAVSRFSHSVQSGNRVTMSVHYLVADSESGVNHFTDTHVLTLFEQAEYEAALENAGCRAEYVPGGSFRLGLFVGVRK